MVAVLMWCSIRSRRDIREQPALASAGQRSVLGDWIHGGIGLDRTSAPLIHGRERARRSAPAKRCGEVPAIGEARIKALLAVGRKPKIRPQFRTGCRLRISRKRCGC